MNKFPGLIPLLLLCVLFSNKTTAQLNNGGLPESFKSAKIDKISVKAPVHEIPKPDLNALMKEDEIESKLGIPFRFGKDYEINLNVKLDGIKTETEYGNIWLLNIKGEGAYTLNLIFSKYGIPENSKLFIYNKNKSDLLGAFTSYNNKPGGKFSTSLIKGDEITIEYFEPFNPEFSGELEISRVIYGYKDILNTIGSSDYCKSGYCNINVNCDNGFEWQNQKSSVAMILSGGGTRICTGTLINNPDFDGEPYFLSANHCFNRPEDVETWVFLFNYESPGCKNQDGQIVNTVSGAEFMATNSETDFLLLKLYDTIPSSYNVYYSGWSNIDLPAEHTTTIHHPNGDIKKISFDFQPPVTNGYLAGSGNDHWQVLDWDLGTTEKGSSGSPLFNEKKLVVGQLHGGFASCSNNEPDYYGKFASSWNYGDTLFNRLREWLDPNDYGIKELPGYDPNNNNEYYISIVTGDTINYNNLDISVSGIFGDTVFAYVNPQQLKSLIEEEVSYEFHLHPGERYVPDMYHNALALYEFDAYPSYQSYVNFMYDFAASHPDLCRIEKIGESVEGRDLLFAVISDSVNKREAEPRFMYTSTMHGDELVGYVLMLRLIDYLLENYHSDPYVQKLVNNLEIWINPLANPDGTYANGDSTIYGSMRYNSNSVDLNRNFPDILTGVNSNEQPETKAFRELAEKYNFTLSANIHSGREVVNYPWDRLSVLHADNDWYESISRKYADTVHANAPSGYLTFKNNGITNGYRWYTISGGRQDFMNFYAGCKEVTLELADTMVIPEQNLGNYWTYNKKALLDYMEHTLYGIKGRIIDENSNPVIRAKVLLAGHDTINSFVYTDSLGYFYRPAAAGIYDLTVEVNQEIFEADTLYSVAVKEDSLNDVGNIILKEDVVSVTEQNNLPTEYKLYANYPNPFNPSTKIEYTLPERSRVRLSVYDVLGRETAVLINEVQSAGRYSVSFDAAHLSSGIYFYTIQAGGFIQSRKMILLK